MRGHNLLLEIDPHTKLYRDERSGIAWVENGHTGLGHSCHANIDSHGSERGMKENGGWAKGARTVKSHGFIYNTDTFIVSEGDELDALAAQHCQCGGRHAS